MSAFVIRDDAGRFWEEDGWQPHLHRATVFGLYGEAEEALDGRWNRVVPDPSGCRIERVMINADGRTVPLDG